MRTKQVLARTTALWGMIAATTSIAVFAAKPPVAEDTSTNPAPVMPAAKAAPAVRSAITSGDEGAIAGAPVLLWDNGSVVTTASGADCPTPGLGDLSRLQNNATAGAPAGQCLNVLGFGNTAANAIAEDFTLSQPAKIERVTLYAYTTNSTVTPTITGASATLHSGRPFTPGSNVIAGPTTLLAGPATFPKYFRMSQTTINCARSVQQVTIDTSTWPALPAGTYWISMSQTGGGFCPPVTVLGAYQKPGANAMQLVGTNYGGLFDTGATPAGCPTYPTDNLLTPGVAAAAQDMPFILEGDLLAACVGDTNNDGNVNVADLLAVIGTWGACAGCPTDINNDGQVNVADLLSVIANWGACPPGPPNPPAPATGACTIGTSCTSGQTFNQCFLAGGTYGGDGTTCLGACCVAGSCSQQSPSACATAAGVFAGLGIACPAGACPPANDDCANAAVLAATQTASNVFATTTTLPANATCTPAIVVADITKDLWYSLATVNGQSYTVSTGTSAGGTGFDTVLEVFTGGCGVLSPLACNDDIIAGTDLRSSVTFTGDGSTMLIRVSSWQNGGVGNVTITRTP